MNCRQFRKKFIDQWSQGRDPLRESDLATHVSQCAECSHYSNQMLQTITALGSPPNIQAPRGYKEKVMRQILEVSNTNEKASRWLALWKPAVAVGVAATLIIALLIGGVFSSGTPAYAVEQTVKSIHAIRFVNFDISVEQMPAFSEKFWTELDETGNIRRARISVSGDGAAGVEALWQGDQFELWDKQANTHFINFKDRAKTEGFRQPANGLNPAHIIDELIQQQEKGNLQFVTEQPKNTNEPIILKATWSKPEQDRPEYDVLKIDPKTYLPTQLYRHNMKNGQNQYSITIHYQYPEKVDPAVFKLQVPANVPLQNGNFRPAK